MTRLCSGSVNFSCAISYICAPPPPSWKERPEEVLEAIRWVRENDAEAERIAGNAQRLAVE